MKEISFGPALRLITRGTYNYYTNRALTVSYEVTHSCTADCRHCDKGGMKPGEKQLKPEDYRRLQSILKPIVVQISGGEPLTRKDVVEIAKAIKEPNGLPYLIVVTNGSLLTKEKYLELKEAGVNQFSISLDFPNEKHDEFRRIPGLYKRLEKLIPELVAFGKDDIVINTAITSANLHDLRDLYKKAVEWGISLSVSSYTPLRTGDPQYCITGPDDLKLLQTIMDEFIEIKKTKGNIINSGWTLKGTYEYFKNGTIPGCKAGLRYLVITPDGKMRPCSMFEKYYGSQKEMIREFVNQNDCGGCYVAIRAYLDKPYWKLLTDNVQNRVLHRNSKCKNC